MSEPLVRFERMPAAGPITGLFGQEYSDGPKRWQHRGVDIGCREGTPVYAPAAGKVVTPFNDGSFGIAVCLDHGDGWFSLYAHNSRAEVSVGETVRVGQRMALSGATGYVSGAHVHWQLSDSSSFPIDIAHSRDPLRYLYSEEEMDRLARLESIVAGNGMMCVPWADAAGEDSVLGCFPAGTAPTPRDHPDPNATAIMLTGEAGLEYSRIRGFSLGYGVFLARNDLAKHVAAGQ